MTVDEARAALTTALDQYARDVVSPCYTPQLGAFSRIAFELARGDLEKAVLEEARRKLGNA